MRQVFEFSVFLAGATALHLAVGYVAPSGPQAAAGSAGEASVTLAAADTSLQMMIADWDRPVEVVQQVAQPAQPVQDAPEMAPVLTPMPESPTVQRSALQRPLASDAPALPKIDQTIAPKPKLAEQRPKLRPAAKPKPATAKSKPAPAQRPAAQQPVLKKSAKATPPQKAAGAGGKKAAGAGTAPKANPGKSKKLAVSWGGQIRSSIERRKRYPSGTRASGTATLAISVHTRGAIVAVSLLRSSGVAQLDRAAIAAVKSARISAAPKGLPAGVHKFTIPIKLQP